jgi:hypothetical protein
MPNHNNRSRLNAALAGQPIDVPVYAAYDWFIENRLEVDWKELMRFGLARVNHANIIRYEHPNLDVREVCSVQDGLARRDVYWTTDIGELHEWYLGEWKQEHFIKTPQDYRIMKRALEGLRIFPDASKFLESETTLGDHGITIGHLRGFGLGRTSLMALQIDWVGLEQFSMDLAYELSELNELLEVMSEITLEEMRQAVKTPVTQIKLWENLSIETLGPIRYRRHLVPLYEKILAITDKAGKKLQVHYDGKLNIIKEDIASLGFDGIDSFTEPPEGDIMTLDARRAWPDKMLWCNLPLGWYQMPRNVFLDNVRNLVDAMGGRRFCLMISEDVPENWKDRIPLVLELLAEMKS